MSKIDSISELLQIGDPSAQAICAPNRLPLSYEALNELVERTGTSLNKSGIGRNDRVAIVLPNGAEMATCFVCVAAFATAAPLNPGYKLEEFIFYLDDLKAKALIIAEGSDTVSRQAAQQLGIDIFEIKYDTDRFAGDFDIRTDRLVDAACSGYATSQDIALILHTSGTTSRPKIVPLSHANVSASALNIGASLSLDARDKCLNIMPLFHIHGLIAAILASLQAGASIYCSPGFNALKFFNWMHDAKPSWYTAVPTMHQTILSRAEKNKTTIQSNPLRFIRSSSASLPPQVMADLETTFQAPVIEAYGMTEASHQMACNPLPPATRKAGTVGIAAGPEVAIMGTKGEILGAGETGEIVIRGTNVTAGYENNPKANAENFTNGWFRTGDQGALDSEQYLSITGRLKEIINRGGEKISPREVDDVLMDIPAIAQCVTFAMPHSKLGEDVAAAVVLHVGESITESEIRQHTANYLADFKVPRRILILDEIPKGATGKLQRIGLAEKLGLVT